MATKALKIGKASAKGGLSLFLGVSLSSIISALGTIFLVRVLSPEQYGLYAIALIPPAFFIMFRDWGIRAAMIKHLAQYRAEDRPMEIKRVLTSGILFELLLGSSLSLMSFFLAEFLAIAVFRKPEAGLLISVASISILGDALLAAAQSAFIGFERMNLVSLITICVSTLRSLIAPILVFLGYGTVGAVLGYTISFIVAGILGIIILYLYFYKDSGGKDNSKPNLRTTLKTMLGYGVPLALSGILSGALGHFYSFMMVIYCTSLIIGNYQAGVSFMVLVTFFSSPVTTVLFPAFSQINPNEESETLKTVFQSSIRYTSLLTVPATVAIMVLSKPLVWTLFGEKYSYAPLFLALYAISSLYITLGSLTLGDFLKGQGKTMMTMKLTLVTLAIGFPLGFLLIPRFEIMGILAINAVLGLPSLAIGLWWVRKHFDVALDLASSIRILAASATAAAVAYLVLFLSDLNDWMSLLGGGTTFLIAYLTVIPLIGAVDIGDINNLRQMLSGLGPFFHLFNLPLTFIEKLIKIRVHTT